MKKPKKNKAASPLKNSDKIFIKRLRTNAIVGILPQEQAPQEIWLNLEFALASKKAAESDDLKDTIDYSAIRLFIIHYLQQHSFNLLESLANKLAQALIKEFAITQVSLSVSKPTIFNDVDEVGVKIHG